MSQDPQVTGLAAFQRKRKANSREQLLAAAVEQFGRSGYSPVSVEDIASAAGVSRMTFYRHFRGKADLATALFDRNVVEAGPDLLHVCEVDWWSRGAVHGWLERLFAVDHANRMLLRVFVEAAAVEPDFTRQAHAQIDAWITTLGDAIPAFALNSAAPGDRRRWLEAWLLVYEILDQSNHAALDSGVANDPLMLDILTDRFLAFVASETIA
ncbi:TetR/AcrR family transcriptional regulator [Sphingomonas psychrolutea]|nr:TetR/AcrR family transcriptional regulator [Sphingomonas psychrolutea]